MFAQTELDNYKLQVELLEEKLRSSEKNRQELELELERMQERRKEHDRTLRAKRRQQFQELLNEQTKRNERNKTLLQMLERIDQQTAMLTARSEQLRMMKMQYEMYFAKLVQAQTMRSIQATATVATMATPIPLLSPTPVMATPIVREHIKQAKQLSTDGAAVLDAATQANSGMPDAAMTPHQWTYAIPTAAGMLLTNSPMMNPPAYLNAVHLEQFQPMQYPTTFSYTPRPSSRYDEDIYNKNKFNDTDNAARVRATLRDKLPLHDLPADCDYDSRQVIKTGSAFGVDKNLEPTLATTSSFGKDNKQQQKEIEAQQQQQVLTAMSATSSPSTSLAFDKLPKSPMSIAAEDFARFKFTEEKNIGRGNGSGSGSGNGSQQLQTNTAGTRFNELAYNQAIKSNNSNISNDKVSLPTHLRTTQPIKEDINGISKAAAGVAGMATNIRQQIDDMKSWLTTAEATNKEGLTSDNKSSAQGSSIINNTAGGSEGIEPQNANIAGEFTISDAKKANTQDEINADIISTSALPNGNQFLTQSPMKALPSTQTSIENIENAIYGELVNPSTTADKSDVRNVTQELFEELATQPQTIPKDATAEASRQSEATEQNYDNSYQQYSTNDPTYATIENTTNAEVYQSEMPQINEYNLDSSATGTAAAIASDYEAQYAAVEGNQAVPQDYANVDYSAYDNTQYAAEYDPNAYPGYIYDETTGQYIPDPAMQQQQEQQYATSDYPAEGGYDVNQGEMNANYDYNAYPTDGNYATDVDAAANVDYNATPTYSALEETATNPAVTEVSAALTASSVMPQADKPTTLPTSILATTATAAAAVPTAASSTETQKKKKRVNFVDSETDESSTAKAAGGAGGTASSESDFDFSSDSKSNMASN